MSLDIKNSVAIIAILGVGLLTGSMAGTGLAAFTARGLQEESWVLKFQLEDHLFARAMPPLMLGTLLALAAACVLNRGQARVMFGTSTLFMLLVLAVTIGFQVPLNKQIQSWMPGSAPPKWSQVRDLWLQRHLLRTIAGLLSFVCALLAMVA